MTRKNKQRCSRTASSEQADYGASARYNKAWSGSTLNICGPRERNELALFPKLYIPVARWFRSSCSLGSVTYTHEGMWIRMNIFRD